MGRLEDLAVHYANAARWELSQALNRIATLDDEGTLHDKDLARIAYAYQRMSWWQQVTDLTHGREDTVDGATALLTVRQRAQDLLINARPVNNGGLFVLAMAEARRGGARLSRRDRETRRRARSPLRSRHPPGRRDHARDRTGPGRGPPSVTPRPAGAASSRQPGAHPMTHPSPIPATQRKDDHRWMTPASPAPCRHPVARSASPPRGTPPPAITNKRGPHAIS
ncbi:hypothetical protein ACFQQB_12385 [Nonomuraea rubra]|uniref:hypothetical protein n=1 Tax=Nonomuraea rubra TaxID=46180 RepID=UPI00361DC9A7